MSSVAQLPRVVVELHGGPLPPAEAGHVAAVKVQQKLSAPALAEVVFEEPRGRLGEGRDPEPGSAFAIRLEGVALPLFAGEVSAVERRFGPSGERELRVRGYDRLQRLRLRQPVRTHVQVTVADLAREMVSGLGVGVEAAEPGPAIPRLIQYRTSDLDFLVEVADRFGLHLVLRGDVLHLVTLEGLGDARALALGSSLLEARIECNQAFACRSVEAAAWDPLRAEMHTARADQPRVGPSALEASASGWAGLEVTLADETAADDDVARSIAQAELDRRAATAATLWAVADGDPALGPGARVAVDGMDGRPSETFVLTAVTHSIDRRSGFVSELSSRPPAPRLRARGAVLTLGDVARTDDPDGLGRVQLTLPALAGAETGWLGVLCAGAGPAKGLVAVPEAGDQVLVLFSQEDPAQGVVLGGLYGTHAPPDRDVSKDCPRPFTLVTAAGQRIRLDDVRKLLRIEDGRGSFLELGPDRVTLHARVDLEIGAPGRNVVIQGKAIDFREA